MGKCKGPLLERIEERLRQQCLPAPEDPSQHPGPFTSLDDIQKPHEAFFVLFGPVEKAGVGGRLKGQFLKFPVLLVHLPPI